jgi:hypothetical protein
VIALKDIMNVAQMDNGMFLQDGFHYWEISYFKTRLIFATQSNEKSLQWITRLKDAVKFANY